MKSTTYQELKNINYKKNALKIITKMTDTMDKEPSIFSVIQLSYLALSYKDLSSKNELIEYVSSEFDDEYTSNQLIKYIQKIPFELIEFVSNEYDKETLQSVILFIEDDSVRGDLLRTPVGITKLVNKLLNINSNDIVLDLGSGVGSYLLETNMTTEAEKFCGVEINIQKTIILMIRAKVTEIPMNVKLGNILSDDYREFEATKVFSNPPLGVREPGLDDTIKDNAALADLIDINQYHLSADWAFVLSSYANQKSGGKTVVIMSNKILFRESDKKIREKIISSRWLEAIIALPEKLFSNTAIPFTLLVFSENNDSVKMIDASNIGTRDLMRNILTDEDIQEIMYAFENENEITKILTYKDFESQDFILTPNRYFGFIPDASKMTPIEQLSKSISRGAMIPRKELDKITTSEATEIKYLRIQDIDNVANGINLSELLNLQNVEEKYHNHFLEDGDIVISKSHPYKIAILDISENEHILAAGNLYYVRVDKTLANPKFIEIYLNSDEGQAQLERLSTGTVIGTISIKNLKSILIPNLSIKEQDALVNEYQEYSEQLILLDKQKEMISQRRNDLIERVLS